jgi:hypothetical protein
MRDALPQALDEAVVAPGAFVIHAELDAGLLDPSDKGSAGDLAAPVGVQLRRRSLRSFVSAQAPECEECRWVLRMHP